MASKKVTITLEDQRVEQIRTLVGTGRAASVSGFVQHAVGVALDDVAGWGAMLAQALAETGGPMSADERAWADEPLGVPKPGVPKRSPVTMPASALSQAIRRPERQARLSRLIRQPSTDVVALDRVDSVHVGRLLAASGTSDVVDAHVVVCARRFAQRVVTSDPDDLLRLDGTLTLIVV
jgi:Arc/MetJ-type ribon-helix-helix transcriptional regulator